MSVFQAAAIAFAIGQPLNRYVTIRMRTSSKIGPLLHHIGDWLRWHTAKQPAYVYALEAPNEFLHAHILLHIPKPHLKRFNELLPGWLSASSFMFEKGLRKSKPIHHSGTDDSKAYLCAGVLGLCRYICKDIDPAYADRFGIRPSPQGWIAGKRCGYSEAISPNRGLPGHTVHLHGNGRYWLPSPEMRGYGIVRSCWSEHLDLPSPRER
jgi:hypothetical protein